MRPVKLIVPGIFLLLLGVGNITVGSHKRAEYEVLYHRLSGDEAQAVLIEKSPIGRLVNAFRLENRDYHKLSKAHTRLEFYDLVVFGGKTFSVLGLILLLPGFALAAFRRSNNSKSQAEKTNLPDKTLEQTSVKSRLAK